jgi:hypothetical protein
MKISKRTERILEKMANRFLFERITSNTINEVTSFLSSLTNIPKYYLNVELDGNSLIFGYFVSEGKYQEFIFKNGGIYERKKLI